MAQMEMGMDADGGIAGIGSALGGVLGCAPMAIDPSALPYRLELPEPAAAAQTAPPVDSDGVAVIRASGIMLPRVNPAIMDWGIACSPALIADRAEQAVAAGASGVLIIWHSPGGSVFGVADAAERLAAVNAAVPVVSAVEWLCASGAYHLASQSSAIVVQTSALCGSVGVYTLRVDISEALDDDGISVILISRGDGKGDGMPHQPMTAAEQARTAATVDHYYGLFAGAVASGRGVTRQRVAGEWGARTLPGSAAVAAGMADWEGSAAGARSRLASASGRSAVRSLASARDRLAVDEAHPTMEPQP